MAITALCAVLLVLPKWLHLNPFDHVEYLCLPQHFSAQRDARQSLNLLMLDSCRHLMA